MADNVLTADRAPWDDTPLPSASPPSAVQSGQQTNQQNALGLTPAPVPQAPLVADRAPWDDTPKPIPPVPLTAEQQMAKAAKQDVIDYEDAKDFDYTKSPLRYIFSEDNARALVQSQRKSDDASKAFSNEQENAILMGAGHWLNRTIHGDEAEANDKAISDAHTTAANLGTGAGVIQDAAIAPAKAMGQYIGGKMAVQSTLMGEGAGVVPKIINVGKDIGGDIANGASKLVDYIRPVSGAVGNFIKGAWKPIASAAGATGAVEAIEHAKSIKDAITK